MTERPVGEIRPGDHAAFSFTTAEEQAQVIGPFLHDGLAARQKVIYVSDVRPRQLPGLGGRPYADNLTGTGQLLVIPRDTACLTRGRFDPDRMLAVVGREIAQAFEQGYPAVRVTADMSWVLDQSDGYPLLLACEAGFEKAIAPDTAMMAICQLDSGRCAPDHLRVLHAFHQIRMTANPEFDDGVLRITRSHAPEGLRLAGELDVARQGPFMTALTSIAKANIDVHLDFAHVRFVDLGTINILATYALHTPPGQVLIMDELPPEMAGMIETLGWRHLPGLTPGRPRRP